MVFFIGCDVSKNNVDVALVDGNGSEVWSDKIPNMVQSLAAYFLTVQAAYPDDKVTSVVESTACYHHPVCEAAYAVGLPCLVFNPLITKQQIKATVRGKKTDKTDAVMIARLGLRGEGRLYTPEPYRSTKYYARGQQKLATFVSSLKRYEQHLNSVLEVELNPDTKLTLQTAQAALRAVKANLANEATAVAPSELITLLRSIPGVGPYVSGSLIGEIQDMERFTTSKALIAYAGLDPKVRQSGHTLNNTGRLTKRGSPYLRRSLFIAANIARQRDPNLKTLYERKRAEGKSYTVAVCAVARKLLAVIRAVWLRGTPYTVDFNI